MLRVCEVPDRAVVLKGIPNVLLGGISFMFVNPWRFTNSAKRSETTMLPWPPEDGRHPRLAKYPTTSTG